MRTRGGHLSLLPVCPLRCSPTMFTCYDVEGYSLERLGDGKRVTPWPSASCMHTPCSGKLILRSRLVFPTSVISTCGVLSAAQESSCMPDEGIETRNTGRPSPASSPPFPGVKQYCISLLSAYQYPSPTGVTRRRLRYTRRIEALGENAGAK